MSQQNIKLEPEEPATMTDLSGSSLQDHVSQSHVEATLESTQLSSEAISHFAQFPANQFMTEDLLNQQPQASNSARVVQSKSSYPLQPLDSDDAVSAATASATTPGQVSQAQWSAQTLNHFVPQFYDEELDRVSSGASVIEEGAILGESGRTYHSYKDGVSSYLLPNDPAEQDRLDFQHAMMTLLWDGRLVLAPLPRAPRLVLDVATGTGIWALEYARANPTSFVVGTDLSKIQPVPDVPNCLFEKMDCEEDWLWTYKFDYIHIRMIVTAIKDPKRLIQQAFQYLNPGGWLEIQDADMDLLSEEGPEKDDRVATSYLKRWFEYSAIGASMNGIDLHKAKNYQTWITEAGFSEVREEKFKVPCTAWPRDRKQKRVGRWMSANYLSGLRGVSYKMLRSAGMAAEDIESFIGATRDEVKTGDIRGYTPWYAVYGRKPFH
ncbi:uncharacterized protein JN550_000787 [Neoarthrinium moseri]|uniref:uncharacterized protein n=1 Tax=Neoarthrinium moseri TaxID=1658444 RepID=UPI001FDAE218|nr:uncharacterized protein JN550_000787 [Neoarthrinium moseri]KAI1876715.1 hypothetical protein JN550_000787 [Neoarthrinium moseri]